MYRQSYILGNEYYPKACSDCAIQDKRHVPSPIQISEQTIYEKLILCRTDFGTPFVLDLRNDPAIAIFDDALVQDKKRIIPDLEAYPEALRPTLLVMREARASDFHRVSDMSVEIQMLIRKAKVIEGPS